MNFRKVKRNLTLQLAILGLAGSFVVSGCNVGNAPPPMSDADVQAKVGAMTPQQQMDFIAGTPEPTSKKLKEIHDIEAKTGVKDSKPYPSDGAPPTPGASAPK